MFPRKNELSSSNQRRVCLFSCSVTAGCFFLLASWRCYIERINGLAQINAVFACLLAQRLRAA